MTAARAALAITVACAVLGRFDTAAAAAETRLRVVIVIDESDDPFAERIRAEVSALGLEVVVVEPWRTGEPVESLDAAGRAVQAAAAIRMVPSRKGVEVWVANQPTGRSLLRQLIVDENPGAPNEGLVALQTAELLRTTLLSRSDLPPAPPRTPTVEQPKPPPPPPPSPPVAGLQAAGGVLYSPGAGNAAMQLWLTGAYAVARPFGVAVDVSGPLGSSTIDGPEGSARVRSWLVGATLFLRRDPPESRLYGIAAAGGGVIHQSADANANAPLLARSASTNAATIYARVDAGVTATRWLRVGLRGAAGVVPQGVSIRFAGNEAAVWGRPFLVGLLVVDLSW